MTLRSVQDDDALCADRDVVDHVEVVADGISEALRELVAPAASG